VCRAHADRLGHQVVEVYTDAGITGTTTNRPGLQRMLADAAARRFKALILSDLSRLSRDRVDLGVLVRQLADLGVRVIDVETQTDSDDDSSDTIHAVKAIVGAEYIKAVRVATHRQLQTRALAGYNPGGKSYGYTSVEEVNPADPTKPRHRLVIDEAEAAVVRRIFERAAAGSSPREIAHALNEDGVPAPHDAGRGNKGARGWGHTTIRAMLQARRYIGEVVWNAFKWKKTAKGTRRKVARPESEHVKRTDPTLAIIDPETFAKIGARYAARKVGPTVGRAMKPKQALSGLLQCGVCGGTFGVIFSRKHGDTTYRTLGCVAHKDRGDTVCANRMTISDRKVIRALADHLRERMSDPDRVAKFVTAFQEKFSLLEAKGVDPREELLQKIAQATQTINSATQALLLVPDSQALATRLQSEERSLRDLQAKLDAFKPKRPTILLHPTAVAAYVAQLADVLESGDLVRTGDILRTALAPFRMIPQADGYRMVGAINLGLSDQKSSGGPLPFPS
jgi:DNA invertase Pin-like site-specific DNA recombinase